MKTLRLVFMLTPVAALAATPFDGSWVYRAGSLHMDKPEVLSLDQNEYRCESCVPRVSVKPDGQFHKVSGHGYDSVSARIIDPRTLEVTERNGEKVVLRQTLTASPDGSKLKMHQTDESGEKPESVDATLDRSAGSQPQQGKHPVSGLWVITSLQVPTDIPITLRMTHDDFDWSWNGQHYDAKFDGKPVPLEGDPSHLMVTVKRLGPREVEETDSRNGEAVFRTDYSISPDDKSMKVTESDPRTTGKQWYTRDKQP